MARQSLTWDHLKMVLNHFEMLLRVLSLTKRITASQAKAAEQHLGIIERAFPEGGAIGFKLTRKQEAALREFARKVGGIHRMFSSVLSEDVKGDLTHTWMVPLP